MRTVTAFGLPSCVGHPDAAARDLAPARARPAAGHRLVALALLGRQHLGDARARLGAQPLGLLAALALVLGVDRRASCRACRS